MMKQLHTRWEALPRCTESGNLGGGRSLLSQVREQRQGERIIVTWTGTPEDVQQIVEANDRMSFLLAVATELARIRSPQELICTAMARLRERLGAAGVTLAEFDEQRNEAIVLRESGGDDESRIEVASLPLE
jgi:hypothetical protein